MKLMNLLPPQEDEFLSSYFERIAKINGMTMAELVASPEMRLVETEYHTSCNLYIEHVLKSIAYLTGDTPDVLFAKLSIFDGIAPLLPQYSQQRSMMTYFRKLGSHPTIFTGKDLVHLKVCPVCAKEDLTSINHVVLYRAHQMPGVAICHKHRVRLKEVPYRQSISAPDFHIDQLKDYQPLEEIGLLPEFAEYAKAWLDSRPTVSLETLHDLVRQRLSKLGLNYSNPAEFTAAIKAHCQSRRITISKGQLDNISYRRLEHSDSMDPERTLYVLFLLWPDISELLNRIHEIPFDFSIPDEYDTIQKTGILLYVRHKACNKSFIATAYGLRSGYGCPYCDRDLSEEEKYLRVIKSVNPEYKLISPYKGIAGSYLFQHIPCGKLQNIRAGEMYRKQRVCACSLKTSDKEYEQAVSDASNGQYELLGVDHLKNGCVTLYIKCKACGAERKTLLASLHKHPACGNCRSLRKKNRSLNTTETDFRKALTDLTGEDYVLDSSYKSASKPVTLRHTVCGQQFSMKPMRFLHEGLRCPHCRERIEHEDFCSLIKQLSGGEYEVSEKTNSHSIEISDRSGNVIHTTKRILLAELIRPTESLKFPLEEKIPYDQCKQLIKAISVTPKKS